jgi:hypothetical protein
VHENKQSDWVFEQKAQGAQYYILIDNTRNLKRVFQSDWGCGILKTDCRQFYIQLTSTVGFIMKKWTNFAASLTRVLAVGSKNLD